MNLPDDPELDNLLIIDIDDVCLDTLTGFVKWLSKHDRLHNIAGNAILSREVLGTWLNVPDELANHWMKDFSERSWEWGALYPMMDSRPVISELYKEGWNLIAVCRGSTDLSRATLRRANLELVFPGLFDDVYVLGLHANLHSMLKNYQNAICVTSTELVAAASAQAGHITYLLDQPWNRTFNNMSARRFNDWAGIKEALDKIRQDFT